MSDHTPTYDSLVRLQERLNELQWKAKAASNGLDVLTLVEARDAVEMYNELLVAVCAHRGDTFHLIEKLAAKGYKPRLADRMLYEAAGLESIDGSL